jgi:hypothetical protein
MNTDPTPNSPARPKTYRLLLSYSQLQDILVGYTALRHGISLDGRAHIEMLAMTDRHTGQIDQIRVELSIMEPKE